MKPPPGRGSTVSVVVTALPCLGMTRRVATPTRTVADGEICLVGRLPLFV